MSGRYSTVPKHQEVTYNVKTKAKQNPNLDFVSLKKGQLESYRKEHKNSKKKQF